MISSDIFTDGKNIMNITVFIQLLLHTTFLKKMRPTKIQRIYNSKSNSFNISYLRWYLNEKKMMKNFDGTEFCQNI